MSNQYPGGVISKTPPTVSTSSASGIWTLTEQAGYQKQGVWPFVSFAPIEYLVVAGGGGGGQVQSSAAGGGGGAGCQSQ